MCLWEAKHLEQSESEKACQHDDIDFDSAHPHGKSAVPKQKDTNSPDENQENAITDRIQMPGADKIAVEDIPKGACRPACGTFMAGH